MLDREAKIAALQKLRNVVLADRITTVFDATAPYTPAVVGLRKKDTINEISGPLTDGDHDGESGGSVDSLARSDRTDTTTNQGQMKRTGRWGPVSCVEDVYASVTAVLSQALVHCERFEVGAWRGTETAVLVREVMWREGYLCPDLYAATKLILRMVAARISRDIGKECSCSHVLD